MKKCISLIMVFIIFLTGCSIPIRGHSGKYPELFTVAVSSLATESYILEGETSGECYITKIAEDSYGRVMFSYVDKGNDSWQNYTRNAILISQFVEEDKVYFYQNYNFIISKINKGELKYVSNEKSVKNPTVGFSSEEIEQLKEWNDWDCSINREKSTWRKIKNKYSDKEYDSHRFKEIYNSIFSPYMNFSRGYVVSRDNYGNMLVYMTGKRKSGYITGPGTFMNKYMNLSVLAILSPTKNHLNQNYYVVFQDDDNEYYLPFEKDFLYQQKLEELRKNNYWNEKSLDEVIEN